MSRFAAALLSATLLAGCALPPGASEDLSVSNAATVTVRVRIGTFIPGVGHVPDDKVLTETMIASRDTQSIQLPAGKYTIEAQAQTPAHEFTSTFFTMSAGKPMQLTLHETLKDLQPGENLASPDPSKPYTQQRTLSWQ